MPRCGAAGTGVPGVPKCHECHRQPETRTTVSGNADRKMGQGTPGTLAPGHRWSAANHRRPAAPAALLPPFLPSLMIPRMSWFDTARFGMFVHWGHSSQQGIELSWPMAGGVFSLPFGQGRSVDDYQSTAATFDPQEWDAAALAKRARALGMQYAVLTTKHHDGYAMFDTETSGFGVMHAPYGRDIVRSFVDAMRAEGIRVGLYFSLIDWHHPDYPALTEADKPYAWGHWRRSSSEAWQRFTNDLFAQIRELLTNYGRIDVLWFDGHWERTAEEWRADELIAMIRQLQPEILINDRIPGAGDFETPEQFVPAQPPVHRWETCLTINESWGWNPSDTNWKSPRQLVHTLCEVAGKGGNLLLNVSPMGDGRLPAEITSRLDGVRAWMDNNGESIVGTVPGLEPWQFYGPSTRRGNRVYLHLLMRPYESVTVRGIPVKHVKRVAIPGREGELKFTKRTALIDQMLNPDPLGELTIRIPENAIDELATVIAIDFEGWPGD